MIARLVVVGLAATRLTRAVQHEGIGLPLREWMDRTIPDHPSPDQPTALILTAADLRNARRREWLYELVTCDHCLGFWITLATAAAWRIRPARIVVEALASAALLSAIVDHYPQWDFT